MPQIIKWSCSFSCSDFTVIWPWQNRINEHSKISNNRCPRYKRLAKHLRSFHRVSFPRNQQSFTFRFRRSNQRTAHKRILFKSSWSWSQSLGDLSLLYKATSLANILTQECWTTSWISLIYNKKSNGPKTEPCGIPELTGNHEESDTLIEQSGNQIGKSTV